MYAECRETWLLCKEYLLCESERALMKLLWELQKPYLADEVILPKQPPAQHRFPHAAAAPN